MFCSVGKKLIKELESIINVKNNTICNMLEFVFYLQPPVATVYIIHNEIENIIEYIETSNNLEYIDENKLNTVNIIEPDKPFLPLPTYPTT